MSDPESLDRIYRYQRHVYDLTRRFILPGRDMLLDSLDVSAGYRILEVGCGTGRNLIILARRHPEAFFYGLDASRQMLATATRRIESLDLASRISLALGRAEKINPENMFGISSRFDRIFFSYSLSMMPAWQDALNAAFDRLEPAGGLHVLDFWDQKSWPGPLKSLFARWLGLFHVRFEPGVLPALEQHYRNRGRDLAVTSIGGRYAYLASPA